jgi:hypothetical protein
LPSKYLNVRSHRRADTQLRSTPMCQGQLNDDGNTPLHLACIYDQSSCIEALCHAGASLDLVNASNDTPLMVAARLGNQAAVGTLLDMKASPHTRGSEHGATALDLAHANNYTAIVRLLKNPQRARTPPRKVGRDQPYSAFERTDDDSTAFKPAYSGVAVPSKHSSDGSSYEARSPRQRVPSPSSQASAEEQSLREVERLLQKEREEAEQLTLLRLAQENKEKANGRSRGSVGFQCTSCTFNNKANVSKCSVCDAPNPRPASRPVSRPTFPSQPVSRPTSRPTSWNCSACTMKNNLSDIQCKVCRTPRARTR